MTWIEQSDLKDLIDESEYVRDNMLLTLYKLNLSDKKWPFLLHFYTQHGDDK